MLVSWTFCFKIEKVNVQFSLSTTNGEFKSVRITDKFKGKGLGGKIINHLINEAKKLNIKKISVETGTSNFFAPARKLFIKSGFEPCEPFAHYKKDPNSCYYTLNLGK